MIIFDLDGTLSIVGDRLKYLRCEPKDWDSFYEACGEDAVNEPVAKLYRQLWQHNHLKIVTGRRESTRGETIDWLRRHFMGIGDNDLHMRADGDYRHDLSVKPELVADFVGEIEMIFEDRDSMVTKWRGMGITCLQVANGNF